VCSRGVCPCVRQVKLQEKLDRLQRQYEQEKKDEAAGLQVLAAEKVTDLPAWLGSAPHRQYRANRL
jgi:hypothetical protein